MDHEEARAIAREAVRETLLTLGMDLDNFESIQAAQADFAFIRKQRVAADAFRGNAIRMFFTVAGLALFGFLTWLATAIRWNVTIPPGTH